MALDDPFAGVATEPDRTEGATDDAFSGIASSPLGPGMDQPQVFTEEMRVGSPEAHQLAEAVRRRDFGLAPAGTTMNAFRALIGRPRKVEPVADVMEIVGGTAGAIAGLAEPSPFGEPAGAVLGAAAGRGVGDVMRAVEDVATVQGAPFQVQQGPLSAAQSMLGAGEEEAVANLIVRSVGPVVGGALRGAGKLIGTSSDAVNRAVQDARLGGLDLAASNLDLPAARGASRVLLVMPIVGGPTRRAREIQGLKASERLESTLDLVAPQIDLNRMGVQLTDAAQEALDARRNLVRANYDSMYEAFDLAGNPRVIPTDPMRMAAEEVIGNLDELPVTVDGGEAVGFPVSPSQEFTDAVQRFTNLPDFITPRELRALQRNLNQAGRMRSGNQMLASEFGAISALADGADVALSQIDREGITNPEVARLLEAAIRTANRSRVELRQLTDTAAAGLMKRIDRNFFTAGFDRPGSMEADEIADAYLSGSSILRSPQFIDNLETLVGPENRQQLARLVLDRAANASEGAALAVRKQDGSVVPGLSDIKVFDAGQMRNRLGLSATGDSGRRNRNALTRLLQGTNLSVDELDAFLKTAQQIQASPAGDPSTFLARRVIFSGRPQSALTFGAAAGTGAEAGLGLVSAGSFILTGRQLAKLLSTPKGLELLREGVKPNIPARQAALLALRTQRVLNSPTFVAEPDEDGGVAEKLEFLTR